MEFLHINSDEHSGSSPGSDVGYIYLPQAHIPLPSVIWRSAIAVLITISWCCLVYGLSTSSRVFSPVAGAVLHFLRSNGIVVFACLNDWLLLGSTDADLHANTVHVLNTLHSLGWIKRRNLSQIISYVLTHLNFISGVVFPTDERVFRSPHGCPSCPIHKTVADRALAAASQIDVSFMD